MEPTQKLDEDEEPPIREKVQAEEIGFLGICGKTYPVTMGPNHIGRDEKLANICLNLESISKLHAVINILSKKEYMLMDLNSSNKTKVGTKTLQPYIQYPIYNGDIIHFGKVFGIFRLHNDDSNLPCTQAEPVPETPVKCIHSIHSLPTQIPESPEVSEDDSFFSVSVRNGERDSNIKKTNSMNNAEIIPNIHEMATQLPFVIEKNDNSVHCDDNRRKGIVDISNKLNRNQSVVMGCDNTLKESTQLFDNDQVDLTKCQGAVIDPMDHADLKPDDIFDAEIESKIIDHITIEPTKLIRTVEPTSKVSSQIDKCKNETRDEKVSKKFCKEKVDSPFKVPLSKAKKRDKSTVPPAILNSSVPEDIEEENYYCLTQEIFDDLNDEKISKDELQNNSQIHDNISNYLNVFSPDIVPDPNTPVKCRSKSFIDAELPSSQEIKSSVKSLFKKEESVIVSSDSDSDTPQSEENTPVLFRKKIRSKGTTKINNAILPPRRVRKPNKKYIDSKLVSKINEDEVADREIVMENLKSNSSTSSSSDEKLSRLHKSKEKEKKSQSSKDREFERSSTKNKDKLNDSKLNQQKKDREQKSKDQKKRDDEKSIDQKKRDNEKSIDQKKRDNEKSIDQKKRDDEKKKEQKRREADKKKEQKRKDDERKAHQNKRDKITTEDNPKVEDLRRSDRLKKDRKMNGSSSTPASTSGVEHSRKRTSEDTIERTNTKRRRQSTDRTDNETARSRSLRPAHKHRILFASYPQDVVIHKMFKDLGCEIVTDVFECTIVICLLLKSTTKLLCAVGMGKPIVGPNWIQACADTNMIVDPWKYIMRDEIKEKRLNFNLNKTLLGKRNFLKGYNVSCTAHVPAADLKLIVECSGGVWKEGGPKWLCISNAEDRELWPKYKKLGATIISPEVIFSGVMSQTLNLSNNIIHALPTLRLSSM